MSGSPESPDRCRPLGRRRLLAMLLSAAASSLMPRPGLGGPLDQGIGGTGAAPPTDESDRGIGGTGVIGTIRKFGSIIVNDMRISYPQDAEVRIDGQPATPGDLRLGQVVRVTASGGDSALSTRRIDVTSEVVGPVEKVGGKQLKVLGQSVATGSLDISGVKPGDVIAVSGLRRNDGTIAASLIERSPGAASRVAGPLVADASGGTRIGALKIVGLDPSLVGHRVIVEGARDGERFVASRGVTESALFPSSVRTLSIESYVERSGDRLRLGSGFAVASARGIDLPQGRSVRAVLRTSLGADGRLDVEGLRAGGRRYGTPGARGGGSPGGGGARGTTGGGNSGRGPGGGRAPGGAPEGPAGRQGGANQRMPMDFGRDNRGPNGRATPGFGQTGGGPAGGGPGGFGGGGPGGGGPGGGGSGGGGSGGGPFNGPYGGFNGGGGFGGPGGGFGGGGPGGGFGGGPGGGRH